MVKITACIDFDKRKYNDKFIRIAIEKDSCKSKEIFGQQVKVKELEIFEIHMN